MTRPVGPPSGDEGLDRIRISGLRAFGHHGVLARERAEGQTFGADVVLHLDLRAAAASDDLADTVSYAEVAEEVVAVLGGEPVDLVETLAERIAATVLAHRGVRVVDVTVHKPQAPLTVAFDDVAVTIRRTVAPAVEVPEGVEGTPTAGSADETAEPGEMAEPDEVAEAAEAEESDRATEAAAPDELAEAAAPEEATATAEPDRPDPAPLGGADPLGRRPDAPVRVVLGLGANLGDAAGTLRAAVAGLRTEPGLDVEDVSPLARTAAVLAPDQDDQPDYLNAVVLASTVLSPRELLAVCRRLEDAHGRTREERWGARTLDVDVITYGDLVSTDPGLTLPHPRAGTRAFVLLPWAQVEPDAVLPGAGPVARLADAAADRGSVRWLALDWLDRAGDPEAGSR